MDAAPIRYGVVTVVPVMTIGCSGREAGAPFGPGSPPEGHRGDAVDHVQAGGHVAEDRVGCSAWSARLQAVSLRTMKNWELAELAAPVFAMATVPRL